MQSITFLSLLVLSLLIFAPFVPALAFRGKLSPNFVQPDTPSLPSRTIVAPPHPHVGPSSSAAAAVMSSSAAAGVSSSAAAAPVASSTASSHVAASSSSSASASSYNGFPLNLTVPFSAAAGSVSLRYLDGRYYRVVNNTVGERADISISQQWDASTVAAKLQQLVGDDEQWKRQQKALKRHVKRTNWLYSNDDDDCTSPAANSSSCVASVHGKHDKHDKHDDHKDKHDKHHDKGKSLMSFYLRQAQCRACVQHNDALLDAATWTASTASLPDYAPVAVMKFCTLRTPKLASEQSPLVTSAPLADWEGVCVPAEVECPSATVDMSILSTSTCAADEAVSKQSCTLCVLDGYSWYTSKRAFKNADNYNGQCVDPASASSASVPRFYDYSVQQLDDCPSAVASMAMAWQYRTLFMTFASFVTFVGLLAFCVCLRACCLVRKNRQAALLRLTRATAEAAPAATVAVSVPAVSSAPSAPPAAGYPAAVAASQEYHEPLLSSGLNPPRMNVSSAYPQLHAQQVAVAQPAYAYGRL